VVVVEEEGLFKATAMNEADARPRDAGVGGGEDDEEGSEAVWGDLIGTTYMAFKKRN
jgi:hypothetical protein